MPVGDYQRRQACSSNSAEGRRGLLIEHDRSILIGCFAADRRADQADCADLAGDQPVSGQKSAQ